MENASKALLIAGGVFIVTMVLSLVLVVWNQVSSYYDMRHDVKMKEQLVEFNSKFENYSGQTIRGNELISIMNKVVDYNNYQSGIVGYENINLEINMKGHQYDLVYNVQSYSGKILFQDSMITGNEYLGFITETSERLLQKARDNGIEKRTEEKVQKLSSEIHNIIPDNENDVSKAYRQIRLQAILGPGPERNGEYSTTQVANIKEIAWEQYQLTQFKRALFKCTEVSNSTDVGTINEMKFEVVLENDKIKFK